MLRHAEEIVHLEGRSWFNSNRCVVAARRCRGGCVHILADSVSVLISIFAVLAGLAFGSFLNVCISRLPRHESVVTPRSRCPRCLTPILNRDNIPLLSWMLLRGRCRSCGARIPVRYPLIEAVTAALFLLCYFEFGIDVCMGSDRVLCWLLFGLAATDAETLLLPDALTLPGLALGVLFSGISGLFGWHDLILSWRRGRIAALGGMCRRSCSVDSRTLLAGAATGRHWTWAMPSCWR